MESVAILRLAANVLNRNRMNIIVECYSGYRGEETPRRILIKSKKIEVKEILERWVSPDHRYFKILGEDDSKYTIRYDTVSMKWELTFFQIE